MSDSELTDEREVVINVAFLDEDNDDLPDTWEEEVGLDPTDPDSDGDGDGVIDALEPADDEPPASEGCGCQGVRGRGSLILMAALLMLFWYRRRGKLRLLNRSG